jgi:hypothetical protein
VAAPARVALGAPAAAAARPAGTADSASRQALVIEGDDHLFMVVPPRGWVLDDTAGMGSRIRCVLYPKGQSWVAAPTVMYVNPLHGMAIKERTFSSMLAFQEREFHKHAPKGKMTEQGTLPTGGGKTARLRYYAYQGGAPNEAIAFIPERELVMLIVLSSRTPEGFRAALPAFRELVKTYSWVGSNREFGR